ncbi:MAG TPA: SDR family NAD(P)-dependent oxidoreductase [Polyangiaceae bacterium]|jgi:3-hydroxyacyl-CoA dehydrogenase/3a,7a,12a-trihydroxy-5b-cholest-24-enoyl-CoA hydratase
MADLRFDGRVVIVTGAGNGLGRSHALLFASRGAKVVVNDLGGKHDGTGKGSAAADAVVKEIKDAGGEAVANYDSVEDGDKIVQSAMDAFGKVDVVVNNAGILRDTSFQKLTQQDWDLIYRVHVLGGFKVTHAAWNVTGGMRDKGYGRVIFTASAAGIYGNFGQSNYAMAKLGLVGLSNTLAIEGKKKNIRVNAIAPIAGSRMTETVLPPNLIEALRPEYVSPLVAWLCHESCEETGGLFEVGGGFYAKLRWERAEGKTFRLGRQLTPELLEKNWGAITSFEKVTHPTDITSSMQPILGNLDKKSRGGNDLIDVDTALEAEPMVAQNKYDERDVALYALGVGAAENPLDPKDLSLVYEMSGEGFHTLPTFAVIPAMRVIFEQFKKGTKAPGLDYGFERILHGEQYTEVKRPLPPSAKLTHKVKIKDIFDKGKNAVVVTSITTTDESGEELAYNELTSFVRGAGGWGGDRGPSGEVNVPPDRKPDAVIEEKTHPNQALLYRLSGDINPLHADPNFATNFGFDKPILHGLCTFGFAARAVIKAFSNGDPRYFKSIKVRMADSVFPGETLVTEMWKESDTKITFRTKVKERDKVVLSSAAVELYKEIPKPVAKKVAAAPAAAPSTMPIAADIFAGMGDYLAKNADAVKKIGVVYQFKLTSPESTWTVDTKTATVASGGATPAQCTLELSDADFMAMCTGKADPMKLFMDKKLRISGDLMASQKLEFLKKIDPQSVIDAMNKRGGSAPAASASAPTSASGDVFLAIQDHVEKHAADMQKIGVVYSFKLTNPDSQWTVDLKNAKVAPGETTKPECTLELSDADFMDMTSGKADPMKLFMDKKLRISGNVMASQKLDFLKKIDKNAAAAAVAAKKSAGLVPTPAAAPKASAATHNAPKIFEALQKRLAENPKLAGEIGARVTFVVDGQKFPIDFGGSKEVATVTVADADLTALVKGTSAQSLYMHGQLRVDGDVRVAQKLGMLKDLI